VLSPSSHSDPWTQFASEAAEFVRLPNGVLDAHHLITGQQLDVLVFTDIGMEISTYIWAFARMAPVQAVFWGHPVTTGAVVNYSHMPLVSHHRLTSSSSHIVLSHHRPLIIVLSHHRPHTPSPSHTIALSHHRPLTIMIHSSLAPRFAYAPCTHSPSTTHVSLYAPLAHCFCCSFTVALPPPLGLPNMDYYITSDLFEPAGAQDRSH
jgi:hypothetical protein